MNPEKLFSAIQALVVARDEAEAMQVLQAHPELLSHEADFFIQELISEASQRKDARAKDILSQLRQALRALRSSGSHEPPSQERGELSEILQELSRPPHLSDMPRRIELCRRALQHVPAENAPLRGALHGELGNALSQSPLNNRADNIEQAIEHYAEALKVYTQKDFPEQWAATQNNLAAAYNNRIREDRADNIEQAIEHYAEALKIFKPKSFPSRCRGTAYRLGNLCLEGHRCWPEARRAYSLGMKAAEKLYAASLFQSSRETELAEAKDIYRRAAYSLARSGRARMAAIAMERGRARGLGESLARDRADLERVREKDSEAYRLYQLAVAELQILESRERGSASDEAKASTQLRDQMLQARSRLSEALKRIRTIPGYENFLREPGWQEIEASVLDGQPLVYLVATPAGGLALIVHRPSGSKNAAVDAVYLDGFSEQSLQELLKIWFEAYRRWLEARRMLDNNEIDPEEYLIARNLWLQAIETVTGQLWQMAMGPILGHLQFLKAQQAFLIPAGLLSLLPLHAAWREEDGQRRYLQDNLPIAYIPSARSLAHARRIAQTARAEELLAVDEPWPVKASALPSSKAEVTAINSHFKMSQILPREEATRKALLQALPKAQVVHLSCHGKADWEEPEQSGLLMAHDEMLTVKDLFELHLSGARLASLSACETGIPGTKLPDEVVSLPSALMRAGFAGVLASLWTVPDNSTAELMKNFYQLWRKKEDVALAPAEALKEAQSRVREIEGFQHPFFWAAFFLTGV